MSETHLPALRMALTAMLHDPAYTGAPSAREWVEAWLKEPAWSDATIQALRRYALDWARTKPGDVAQTVRKALGETLATETVLPNQARLGRTREALQHPYQGETMSLTDCLIIHNERPAEDSPMAELYGAAEIQELHRQKEYMSTPPYNTPPKKLDDALQAVLKGKVTQGPNDTWKVQGSEKEPYVVTQDGCSCYAGKHGHRTKWSCYHVVGVELYQRWQKALQPGLFPSTKTVDERLAAVPEAPLDLMTQVIPDPGEDDVRPSPTTIEDALSREGWSRPGIAAMSEERLAAVPEEPIDLLTGEIPNDEEEPMPTATRDVESLPPTLPEPVGPPLLRNGTAPRPTLGSPLLALPLRSIHAISADLARPLPPKCIVEKQQGGRAISFIHWYTAVEVLDAYAPGWRGEVRSIQEVTTVVGNKGSLRSVKAWATTYRITIPCAEGEVYREAIGLEHEDEPIYGDTMTNSQATAFKRCAALFGVAADLYDKDESGEHLTGALVQEKAALLKMLRPELERRGLDPQEVLAWLKRQTQAQRNADLSIGALKALMAHLEIVEADAPEDVA